MKAKTSIGIVVNSLAMGGAEKQSLLQAKLMGNEYDVYYFVQKKEPQLKQHLNFIENERINYIQLSGNIFSRAWQLRSHIVANNIKVIFAFLPLDNLLVAIVSVFLRIKYIGGIRGSHLSAVKFYVIWILQKFFLDYIIFNNYLGRQLYIEKGFSVSKSVVIQNCINNIQKEIIRTEDKKVTILSVGRFTADKDYLTALKAIQLLKNTNHEKEIEYIIVGDGELDEQIRKWINELQLSCVTVVINPEMIEDYYVKADIYFLSSVFEGMPNSIMEALNYSLPVVTTDVGDVKYLVREGINGFLVPAKDAEKLAEKLSELVRDCNKRNTFGMNGRCLLINEFSERRFQDEYLNFTRHLLC